MIWSTEIQAICSYSGEPKIFAGPPIEAPSRLLAQLYCFENGLGYCKVTDELVDVIPSKEDIELIYSLN